MRSLGLAERAIEAMCSRAATRVAFSRPLADQGVVREAIAMSRVEVTMARLLTMEAARLMVRATRVVVIVFCGFKTVLMQPFNRMNTGQKLRGVISP